MSAFEKTLAIDNDEDFAEKVILRFFRYQHLQYIMICEQMSKVENNKSNENLQKTETGDNI